MARIKIKDLPKDMQVSQQEMRNVLGGYTPALNFLSSPWAVAGIVATAIAIPVAVHRDTDPASP